MQASTDRRYAVTDYTFTAPGWRNAQTVEDLARQLHPDAFK
jgi:iron complex transport system substrate-binding protein